MKRRVASYDLPTQEQAVVVLMPEKAEVLGLHQGKFGMLLDVLMPRGDFSWVEWHFLWNNGEDMDQTSADFIGSARVGPGGQWWHLFFVE